MPATHVSSYAGRRHPPLGHNVMLDGKASPWSRLPRPRLQSRGWEAIRASDAKANEDKRLTARN